MVNLSPWRFTIHICCGTSDFISVKLRLDVSVVSAEPNKRHNHRRISFPEQIIHEHLALLHDSDEKIQPHKCHLQF